MQHIERMDENRKAKVCINGRPKGRRSPEPGSRMNRCPSKIRKTRDIVRHLPRTD